MSNHIHLVVSCREGFNLSDVLRDFKKYTATQIVKLISENAQESRRSWLMWLFKPKEDITFWQPDNHAKEISSRDFFTQKMQYIHLNPVRAGIVDGEEAWLYSSARDFYNIKGLIELCHFSWAFVLMKTDHRSAFYL